MEKKCRNCRYWSATTGNDGHCKRFPPQLRMDKMRNISDGFPSTDLINWCGEFKSKKIKKHRSIKTIL